MNLKSTTTPDRALLAGWQAPDLLGIGVVVCDAFGQVLLANETAHDVLRAQDGLQLVDGKLCESEEGACALTDLVEHAARSESLPHAQDCLPLAVPRISGGNPLTVLVRHFQPASVEGSGQPMALVLILNSHNQKSSGAVEDFRSRALLDEDRPLAAWTAKSRGNYERIL
jgi:hypothetical protein